MGQLGTAESGSNYSNSKLTAGFELEIYEIYIVIFFCDGQKVKHSIQELYRIFCCCCSTKNNCKIVKETEFDIQRKCFMFPTFQEW